MSRNLRMAIVVSIACSLSGCAVTDKINLNGLKDPFRQTNAEPLPDALPSKPIKPEERFHEFVEQTDVPAAQSYERAKVWAAGAFNGGIKGVMQIDDPKTKRFVIKGLIGRCNVFQSGRPYEVSFLLDFQAKDNRVRFLFDKILATGFGQQTDPNRRVSNPMAGIFDVELPNTDYELKMVTENCLAEIKNKIVAELKIKKGRTEW